MCVEQIKRFDRAIELLGKIDDNTRPLVELQKTLVEGQRALVDGQNKIVTVLGKIESKLK